MPITSILPGAGNARPSVVTFPNGNVAMLVYMVGDDGGPNNPAAAGSAAIAYTPPNGGVAGATTVTIAPAVGGKTNTLTSMRVANSGTASEFTVNNGSGGPVLFRGFAPAGSSQLFTFDPRISGSVGALLELAVVTAGAAIYATPTGYVA